MHVIKNYIPLGLHFNTRKILPVAQSLSKIIFILVIASIVYIAIKHKIFKVLTRYRLQRVDYTLSSVCSCIIHLYSPSYNCKYIVSFFRLAINSVAIEEIMCHFLFSKYKSRFSALYI